MAKPSENACRDETAAFVGRVAMRRKTWQRRLVADIRVGRDIDPHSGSRTAGLGESWLVAHEEAGGNFPPCKALKSHKMGKESHRLARPAHRDGWSPESLNLIGPVCYSLPLWGGQGRGLAGHFQTILQMDTAARPPP